MRWLVIGGSGFIGTNLVRALLDQGWGVSVLDKAYPGDGITSHPRWDPADFWKVDISGPCSLLWAALRGVDVIVHLAAVSGLRDCEDDPRGAFRVNVAGTDRVLRAATNMHTPRLVYASSGAVAALSGVYSGQKAAAESLVSAYGRDPTKMLHTTSLRFSNVYGPWSMHKTSAVHAFVRAALAGRPLQVVGDGKQQRDFIFVGDVCEAIIAAGCEIYEPGLALTVSCGRNVAVQELAESVVRSVGHGSVEFQRPGDPGVLSVKAENNEARAALRWKPTVHLGHGIDRTVAWYRRQTCV